MNLTLYFPAKMQLRCDNFNKECIVQVSQRPRQHMCRVENVAGKEV